MALHGKVRNMPSFPSSSTQDIFIFFFIPSRFPWFVKPAGQDPELLSTAKPMALGRMDGWYITHNTAQPSTASALVISILRFVLLWQFSSSFYLHLCSSSSIKAPGASPCFPGTLPPALPRALASTKETENGENLDFLFFFFPLLCFSGSSPR